MATRIETILAKARISLADKNKERWSDEDLLLTLDEAHKDFARQSQILVGREELALTVGDPYFDLPDDAWMISRVLFDERELPILTHTDIDHLATSYRFRDFGITSSNRWEQDTGRPEAFLYDRRNMEEGKIYPIPDDQLTENNYTFLDNPGVPFVGGGYFGVTTEIDEYTFNSPFGVVTEVFETGVDFLAEDNNFFGVLTDIADINGLLRIYYIKNPPDITSVEDELVTNEMWDAALKFYVVGHSFLNDIDTEYQAKGAQQLALYERDLARAKMSTMKDHNRSGSHQTNYRRVI